MGAKATRSLLAVLLALWAPGAAAAQVATPAPSCAQAEATIRGPAGGWEYYYAINKLPDCTRDWPLALARLWDSPPRDTSALTLLAAHSGNMRDQRVFDAARRVTLDAASAADARFAAMQVLTMHYHECLTVRFYPVEYALPPNARVRAGLGFIDHGGARSGTVALDTSIRNDALSALDAVTGMTTDPPEVQGAARTLATALRRVDVTTLSCDGNFIRTP